VSGDGKPLIDVFWLMEHDADFHDGVLDELCRGYLDDGLPIRDDMLRMVLQRFRELRAHLRAEAQGKSGTHKTERTMAVMIALKGLSVVEAAEIVAPQAKVTPESARTMFYRWLAEKKSGEK